MMIDRKAAQAMICILIGSVGLLWMLDRYLVIPWVFPDTFTYYHAARFEPAIHGFRTPVFGWLMMLSELGGGYRPLILLQQMAWIGCAITTSALAVYTTGRARAGIIAGISFIILELWTMHVLPSLWFVLTDGCAAAMTTCGTLCMILGWHRKNRRILIAGALLLGIANVIRPVTAGILTATAMLAVFGVTAQARERKSLTATMLLLWLPTFALTASNMIVFGHVALSSQTGFFLAGRVLEIAVPGDPVFRDNALNEALAATLRNGTPPEGFRGRNPYTMMEDNAAYERESALLSLFASQVDAADHLTADQFAVAAVTQRAMLSLIKLHPLRYAASVAKMMVYTGLPDAEGRGYFWSPDIRHYKRNPMPENWLRMEKILGKTDSITLADAVKSSDVRWIGSFRYVTSWKLPGPVGNLTVSLAVGLFLLVLARSIVLIRKQNADAQMLGIAILTMLGMHISHTLVVSLITVIHDPRYRLPGLLSAETACALTIASFWVQQKKTTLPSATLISP